jgi:peptidoglycan/LPS O-acetylase OafA/YrhL
VTAGTEPRTPPDTSERRIPYQPALDGIRAAAVVAVFAYHLGLDDFEGGYFGVDAFFVLSGFLITTLLLKEWNQTRTISLTAFWVRRARRLLPALLLMLVGVSLWAAVVVPGHELSPLRGDSLATLFYGANWRYIVDEQAYFTLAGAASPLRHTWSLAIEEQFYLLWPLIAYACLRLARGRRWLLGVVCVGGAMVSYLWMRELFGTDPDRAYYGTDSRAYQLLIGGALAVLLMHWKQRTRLERVAVHVAGFIGALVFLRAITAGYTSPSGFMLFTLSIAAVITSVIRPERTPLRVVLSLTPIVWVGRISYGLYLWHWPVIVLTAPSRTGLEGTRLQVLQVALTFGLATASFYLVERPIRRGALTGKAALIFSPAVFVATALVIIIGTSGTSPPPPYLVSASVVSSRPATQPVQPEPEQDERVKVLLIGDSMAASMIPGLEEESKGTPIEFHARTTPGCGIVRGVAVQGKSFEPFPWSQWCTENVQPLLTQAVDEIDPDLVLWLSRWETRERVLEGQQVPFGTPEGDRVLRELIAESAGRFTANGARLVFLQYPPRGPNDEAHDDPGAEERIVHVNGLLQDYAEANPDHASMVELEDIVCPGGWPCDRYVDGVEIRPEDGVHFEDEGSRYVAKRLIPRLLKEARAAAPSDAGAEVSAGSP